MHTVNPLRVVGREDNAAKKAERNEDSRKGHQSSMRNI